MVKNALIGIFAITQIYKSIKYLIRALAKEALINLRSVLYSLLFHRIHLKETTGKEMTKNRWSFALKKEKKITRMKPFRPISACADTLSPFIIENYSNSNGHNLRYGTFHAYLQKFSFSFVHSLHGNGCLKSMPRRLPQKERTLFFPCIFSCHKKSEKG